MKSLFVASLVAVQGQQPDRKAQWEEYKMRYGRWYNGPEDDEREQIFAANMDVIDAENQNEGHTYTLGMGPFTDFTPEEFKNTMLMNEIESTPMVGFSQPEIQSPRVLPVGASIPDQVDWSGFTTPVQSQGGCGSCWTYSATQQMETAYKIKSGGGHAADGIFPSGTYLSKQQLLDCDAANSGCDGGWIDKAFAYAQQNGHIASESDYSYRASSSGQCSYTVPAADDDRKWRGVMVTGYNFVARNDEAALLTYVGTYGPVALGAISTGNSDTYSVWGNYQSGVLNNCNDRKDHAVQLVGYGYDSGYGLSYWLVRNSWGTGWGESGRIRIQRGVNMCQITYFPMQVSVAHTEECGLCQSYCSGTCCGCPRTAGYPYCSATSGYCDATSMASNSSSVLGSSPQSKETMV